MKRTFNSMLLILFFVTIFCRFPGPAFAEEKIDSLIILKHADYNESITTPVFLKEINGIDPDTSGDLSSRKKYFSQIDYHKVLGWSTLGMMAATISTGFIIPEKGHCTLAGITTGLAVVTCADGIYEYGGIISIKDGDWKYNTHALFGILATAGFITTVSIADGKGHVVTGIASGAAFSIALGVIYF